MVLANTNHFEFDNWGCPKCGKLSLIKKKFIKRNATIDKIGDVVFYLKQYFWTKCHKYSKVELKNVLEKYKKTAI